MWRALQQLFFGKKPDPSPVSEEETADALGIDGPVDVPITDEIDLHTYRPSDVKDVVEAYLEACVEKGIWSVRIVHGKGKGVLRETTHKLLDRSALVESYSLAPEGMGGWGATVARLRKRSEGDA